MILNVDQDVKVRRADSRLSPFTQQGFVFLQQKNEATPETWSTCEQHRWQGTIDAVKGGNDKPK